MSDNTGATNMKFDSVRAGAVGGQLTRTLSFVALVCGTAIIVFPLLWMVLVSLLAPDRAQAATVSGDLTKLFPSDPQWNNFPNALSQMGSVRWKGFFDALANSIVVTTLVVAGTVLSSSPATSSRSMVSVRLFPGRGSTRCSPRSSTSASATRAGRSCWRPQKA